MHSAHLERGPRHRHKILTREPNDSVQLGCRVQGLGFSVSSLAFRGRAFGFGGSSLGFQGLEYATLNARDAVGVVPDTPKAPSPKPQTPKTLSPKPPLPRKWDKETRKTYVGFLIAGRPYFPYCWFVGNGGIRYRIESLKGYMGT